MTEEAGFYWNSGSGLPTLCINCGAGEFTEMHDTCLVALHGAIVECKHCGTVFHDTGDSPHNERPVTSASEE